MYSIYFDKINVVKNMYTKCSFIIDYTKIYNNNGTKIITVIQLLLNKR